MPDRTFRVALAIALGIGVLLTLAHFAYAVYAYDHCSILYFIGMEPW